MITDLFGVPIHLVWNIIALLLSIITFILVFNISTRYRKTKIALNVLAIGIFVVDIIYIFTNEWIVAHWLLNLLGLAGGVLAVLLAISLKEKKYLFHKYYLTIWGILAILIDGYYILAIL